MDKDGTAPGCSTAMQIPWDWRDTALTGPEWGVGGCPCLVPHSSAPCVGLRVGALPELLLRPLSHGCGATAPGIPRAQVFPWLQHPWEDEGKDFGG